MRIIELEAGQAPTEELQRQAVCDSQVSETVARIVADVKAQGDEAVVRYTKEFDGVEPRMVHLDQQDILKAAKSVPKRVYEALQIAANSITDFHQRQLQQSWFMTRTDGSLLGTMINPLDSVGIYVPGGRASYPSTVLMNAIPAQVAGVRQVVMVTPPQTNGSVSPAVLAAAHLVGITDIYLVGGAQAIAALAYGTETIPAVDKITGPGNAYVAAAKRQVSGDVGIDMIAGPSEVLILADDNADPSLVAIDLLAQAEHDPMAATYLVTFDEDFVDEVVEELERFLNESTRQEITKESIDNNCVAFIVPDLATALLAVNTIAPEHLEIQMDQPLELLGLIENAGAIFLGPWTPESVGDYVAGPSHTLPTGGTARFASPLSVDDFVKRTNVISYSFTALQSQADVIATLADVEGLWAHGRAVKARFESEEDD